MAKKDKINSAYDAFIGEKEPEQTKIHPTSVLLDREELDDLKMIAAELGVSRHEVLKFAVHDFIARYKRGERPKTQPVQVNKLISG
jgi:hypothetical protein